MPGEETKEIVVMVAGTGVGRTAVANLIALGLADTDFPVTLMAEDQMDGTELESQLVALVAAGVTITVREARLQRMPEQVAVPQERLEP